MKFKSSTNIISFQGKTGIEKIGDNLVVKPFLNLPIAENKLTQKKRSYPVDFVYPNMEEYEIIINIPEGYRLAAIPEKHTLNNELAEIGLSYEPTETKLKISAKYSFKKPVYVASEYARIKFYMDTVVKRFNEEVVLEKI